MPPKSSKAAEKAKDLQETEDPLQAVLLADAFEDRFSPFNADTPRVLLPLANIPLIEWTFSFLANAGVDEVFVYCGAHTDQIEDYLSKSTWTGPLSPFRLETVRSTSRSIGDAMRDLDSRAILKNDFLVVYGDVVCNMPMDKVLEEHRARRAADKNAIMTTVLREAGVEHRSKALDVLPTWVVDPAKKRILQYEQMALDQRRLELDPDMLAQDTEVHTDFIDCGIDICTPDVLALWSDNFDYEAPRRGFLHSVLKDYELNGKTFHTFMVEDHYAARVSNLAAYDAISKDVVSRWSYPFCPDSNLYGDSSYTRSKNNVYREDGVKISKSSLVGPNVVIGSGSKVEPGSVVRDSILGRNCVIGKHCKIENAYLWDGVVVGEGSEIRRAIVASDTVIGTQCKIYKGALVSRSLRLADGTLIGNGRKAIGKRKREGTAEKQADYETLAPDSNDNTGLVRSMASLRVSPSQESISTLNSDMDSDDAVPLRRSDSVGSDESRHSGAGENFVMEAANSIYDGFKQGHDPSTMQLELQGLRMSANASEHQVRRAMVGGLMRHIAEASRAGKPAKSIVAGATTLIERTVFDGSSEAKPDQTDFLLLAQADAAKRPGGDGLFVAVCEGLYLFEFDDGVFETEAFEAWWNDERSQKGSDEMARVRAKMEKFMQVIADDDDDDDDDEDEEDDSD